MALSVPMKRQHRLTVTDYHKIAEAGIFPPEARIELINGVLLDMGPIGREHNAVVDLIGEILHEALRGKARIRVQGSLVFPEYGEPQPDIAILKRQSYRARDAGPNDVYFIIEVSDTSLEYDRTTKLSLYAQHGISEYWIVDLISKSIQIYYQPNTDKGVFIHTTSPRRLEAIRPRLLADVEINLSGIF